MLGRFTMPDGTARSLAEATRRPSEPEGTKSVWYRGWECGYDADAGFWTKEGWRAYKGGVDIGAPQASAPSWPELLEAIDDEEDDQL